MAIGSSRADHMRLLSLELLRYDLRVSSFYCFQMWCLKCDQQGSGDAIPFGIQKTPQLHPDVPEPREELLKDTARPL